MSGIHAYTTPFFDEDRGELFDGILEDMDQDIRDYETEIAELQNKLANLKAERDEYLRGEEWRTATPDLLGMERIV